MNIFSFNLHKSLFIVCYWVAFWLATRILYFTQAIHFRWERFSLRRERRVIPNEMVLASNHNNREVEDGIPHQTDTIWSISGNWRREHWNTSSPSVERFFLVCLKVIFIPIGISNLLLFIFLCSYVKTKDSIIFKADRSDFLSGYRYFMYRHWGNFQLNRMKNTILG